MAKRAAVKPGEAAARRDPSRIDFTGQIEILLENATHSGHHEVILTADTIDWQATEFLGGHQCHRLAGAVELMPGDVLTDIDYLRGDPLWWTAEGPIEMLAVLMHFARLLLVRYPGN